MDTVLPDDVVIIKHPSLWFLTSCSMLRKISALCLAVMLLFTNFRPNAAFRQLRFTSRLPITARLSNSKVQSGSLRMSAVSYKVAFMFPGQGAQTVGMAGAICNEVSAAKGRRFSDPLQFIDEACLRFVALL